MKEKILGQATYPEEKGLEAEAAMIARTVLDNRYRDGLPGESHRLADAKRTCGEVYT